MDYKVIQRFRDKYTRELYPVGKILTITEERAAEILAVGKLIEAVETVTEEPTAEEAPKAKKSRKKAEK